MSAAPDDIRETTPVADAEHARDAIHAKDLLSAVLIAEIVGSITLYEMLGETKAKRLIVETLASLAVIAQNHEGRVIKTNGDEIVCLFPSPDNSLHASISMQKTIDALPMISGTKRRIRIGIHTGPVIEENGELFGDTVNIAERMSKLAKGMQIMTTTSTVDCLSAHLQSLTRCFASVVIKGETSDMAVCEVLWRN